MLTNRLYKLDYSFDLLYLVNTSALVLKGIFGVALLKLPSKYYYSFNAHNLKFEFYNSDYFFAFLSSFFTSYRSLFLFFFLRIKLRGLGFRIKRITNSLYRFFFNSVNYIYIHVPSNILMKIKRKQIFILSNNLGMLKKLLNHIILLKVFGGYNIRGFLKPRQIVVLRSGKKNF